MGVDGNGWEWMLIGGGGWERWEWMGVGGSMVQYNSFNEGFNENIVIKR